MLSFVELHALYGIGLSLVDAHLLAALRLSPPTGYGRETVAFRMAADKLGVSADLPA